MSKEKVITAWKAKKQAGTTVQFHKHNCYELVYYVYGSGKTTINENTFEFLNNSFAIIKAGSIHNEIHYETGKVICIGFYCNDIDIEEKVYTDKDNTIFKIVNDILNEIKHQLSNYEDMLLLKVKELQIELKRVGTSPKQAVKSLQFALNYLCENYSLKVNFKNMALMCGYSYDYFHHLFKEVTGCSPQQYLIKKRLSVAQELLTDSSQNCTEIAYNCGFSNSAQFSSLFKKEYGITPKAYQQKNHFPIKY